MEVGPTLPATYIFRPGWLLAYPSAACLAITAPRYAISAALSPSPYSLWDIRLELKVFVSMMSAPASIYPVCILAITSGASRFSRSLFPSGTGEYFCIMVPMAPSSMSILWLLVSIPEDMAVVPAIMVRGKEKPENLHRCPAGLPALSTGPIALSVMRWSR